MSASGRAAGFYGNLESLRGVCALMIVFLHFPFPTHVMMVPGAKQLWLFVDLFFVLSGFVIAHVYLGRVETARAAAAFTIKRFFRLYPLHLVTFLAMAGLLFARWWIEPAGTMREYRIDGDFWTIAAANLALVQQWILPNRIPFNSPAWSISTELLAYLMFAGICLAVRGTGPRMVVAAAVAIVSVAAMSAIGEAMFGHDPRTLILRCLYGFSLGMLSWRLARSCNEWPAAALVAIQCLAIAALGMVLVVSPVHPWLSFAFPLVTMVLVAAMAVDGSPMRRVWETPVLRTLGRLSFSIYLVHSPVITVAGAIINARMRPVLADPWLGDAAAAIIILAILGASALTFRLVEVPGRLIGQRLAQRLEAEPPVNFSRAPAPAPR